MKGIDWDSSTSTIPFELIGASMGTVEEVETCGDKVAWGRFLRVRVRLNVNKPLRRGMMLTVHKTGKLLVSFRYERLPDFCYVCGCLSHHESECDKAISMKRETGKVVREYGPWLRAEAEVPRSNLAKFDGPGISFTRGSDLPERNRSGRERQNQIVPVDGAVEGKGKLNVEESVVPRKGADLASNLERAMIKEKPDFQADNFGLVANKQADSLENISVADGDNSRRKSFRVQNHLNEDMEGVEVNSNLGVGLEPKVKNRLVENEDQEEHGTKNVEFQFKSVASATNSGSRKLKRNARAATTRSTSQGSSRAVSGVKRGGTGRGSKALVKKSRDGSSRDYDCLSDFNKSPV